MTVLYVASDRQGSGKTAVCAAIASDLTRMGVSVAVTKVVTGTGPEAAGPDVGLYERILDGRAGVGPLPVPDGPVTEASLEGFKAAVKRASQDREVLLIEGPTAIGPEEAASLAEAAGARVLVVAGYDADLDVRALAGLASQFGDRLLGVLVNGLTRYRGAEASGGLLPEMAAEGLTALGVVPEDRRLLGVSVSQVADALGGRYVGGEDPGDRLVEHFMVGGMGRDSGELYFRLREHKAVVVRGDRPDIQMSALQTPTACMILTKGIEPIEYVSYEAELERVPIMVVESGTLDTMAALHTLTEGARFDHPSKVERYAGLLREHVETDPVYEALGVPAA